MRGRTKKSDRVGGLSYRMKFTQRHGGSVTALNRAAHSLILCIFKRCQRCVITEAFCLGHDCIYRGSR